MPRRLLIANRGEIAVRIARAAADLGIATVAVYTEDDARALHVFRADDALALPGRGAAGYRDAEALLEVARRAGCDAVHPGYGFLAEEAGFAARVREAGLLFVGPPAEALERLGSKGAARALAERCGVPVLPGTAEATSLEEARHFLAGLPPKASMLIKAVAGGGGRGMRAVRTPEELETAFARCASEAEAAFGSPALYVEERMERARHVEVQILGDREGRVAHLGERECTLQRRHQKLVELAPSPSLLPATRAALLDAALTLAAQLRYAGVGTLEFLVDATDPKRFAFIEGNARLQVEHTVTEEVTGVDLVRTQLLLAGGATLAELGLDLEHVPAPRGRAVQLRVNTEVMQEDGSARPAAGTLHTFEVPTGRGVRVETAGYAGHATSPAFDPLLAKVVVHDEGGDMARLLRTAERALGEFRVEGVPTNLPFLRALLRHPDVCRDAVDTRFVEEHAAELLREAPAWTGPSAAGSAAEAPAAAAEEPPLPPGLHAVVAPLQGTVVSVAVTVGDAVRAGQGVLVLEAMKMEHGVEAGASGVVREVHVAPGDTLREGQRLLVLEEGAVEGDEAAAEAELDLDAVRPDLAEALARHAYGLDESRPEAVARRHGRGHRTARENLADLLDPGSFLEYGPLMVAAQKRRRSAQELMEKTPGDGMVAGIGRVNGELFPPGRSRVVALSYDYMVLAGTQGLMNHLKKDRLFELAARQKLPVVLFAEGGGGRPGDTDGTGVAGLDCYAFHYFARLSGQVPLLGIANGYCFAGNAALLGCCDVIVATRGSNIGMGGPAMVEGGGLGVFAPEAIGPLEVQVANGVVDVDVEDEAEAVRVARRALAYFQGPLREWQEHDPRILRHLVPENRHRVYDVRRVVEHLADTGSVLELRPRFGPGMVTALARVEGRPLGIVANHPGHLGGAIDAVGADKAADFLELCNRFGLPVLFLCDTPGFMVGPDAEKTGQVRRFARMFAVGANLRVPYFTIVLRKGYGLGAQAMAGGSFKAPLFCVSWPTGEFGGMGLEGAVKLGYRNELAAIEDPEARERAYQEMVQRMYDRGKAVSMAQAFEIDDVIDPADTRRWITMALESAPSARE